MGSRIIREYSGISRSPLIMETSSPSFNSYSSSSSKLAEIASRVVRELGHVSPPNEDELVLTEELVIGDQNRESKEIAKREDQNDNVNEEEQEEEEEEEEEFEFSFASVEPDVTADEIFYNGKIRPLYYPLFDTTLLNKEPAAEGKTEVETAKRLPLGKLFLREEYLAETASSCSSSEADELEGVPAESYCVWNPKERKTTSSGMRKKSNSTGSVSKRWKLKNMLLNRSNSVRENNNNNNNENKNNDIDNRYRVVVFSSNNKKSGAKVEGKELGGGGGYGDVRRRSYLSYGQSLGWVNGLSRNLHPF